MTDISRDTQYPVDPLFLQRWSRRAFDGSAIDDTDLLTLFDAARWAPSAFNYQPWRFVYTHRDSAVWQDFLDILMPFNAAWVQNASALIFVLSDTLMSAPGSDKLTPSHSHSFDTGAAWAILALQATRMGLCAHGMTGVDMDKARIRLKVPDRYRVEAAVAVGRMGDKSTLSPSQQAKEHPNGRNPIDTFAFEGVFPSMEGETRRTPS
ncbi:nitroreductase family protein [Rhizorhapis suberifaciens]|uniref:Nitroreductase n=1 Tax=Rhizorhapis suberifaciens TaxID=13656 RepID=A0A840HW73_9SPHN|nr:nitroreductase family protein [Rhizorhapis suberifaciens]MBB4641664.1 nitroreductase [Rhizorhapis suberifaciens]